ncbi:D-alanyl-D-alanine dipeptidase [Fundidesulfovibrio magnetotacticus]|uniref:D-alanyl-D-alanine dipeptidase n=1 Tax=Fundidesulfovibrio magnetotacticus TaxID=2730080 RepID=A0A6V8LTM7_9BACT|nr:M15 family metallopeptidase [Fundidesulfovibrio magnetotacticus]GFK93449.1 D-alanyl-D-alanine dipeptidase [Fundidesulfovibrio magnetotacticus]
MRLMLRTLAIAVLVLNAWQALAADQLPPRFLRLRDLAPDIVQEMRYHGWHNFLGRPVKGYEDPECILTIDAAKALIAVHEELRASGLGVKVYDCYRPQRAVNDFVSWSQVPEDQITKDEFYPRVDKKDFFDLGYVAKKSGHSRGSTVDLTIIPWPPREGEAYTAGQRLMPCNAPYPERFRDNSLDMGTGFDCMDVLSHSLTPDIPFVAQSNRMLLRRLMENNGFSPYEQEWWHFTLRKEPFPDTYFDFPVTSARK